MTETISMLAGNFVVVDLGAADSKGFHDNLRELLRAITLVELDAISTPGRDDSDYFRSVKLNKAISGESGSRIFYKRKFPQCSSFMKPDVQVVSQFGLEDYFVPAEEMRMDCTTLQDILGTAMIGDLDFLKTDLEGLDFEVLRSSGDLLARTLVVQSELRFQPLYRGEARFSEITNFLTERGFDLISLRPEVWKYKTPHQRSHRDGKLVWADGFFFMTLPHVRSVFGAGATRAYLKQILLAHALGFHSYAEWTYENTKKHFPPGICAEVEQFLNPRFTLSSLVAILANVMTLLPAGQKLVNFVNRTLADLTRATNTLRDFPHIGSL